MKFLEKITLIIYSNIMLIISIILCLLIFRWLDYNVISNICYKAITLETPSNIILAISVVFILLSIKCIFFTSTNKEEKAKQGILLENQNGKLMISQETIENLVNTVVKGFESAEDVTTKIAVDKENNLIVYVNMVVSPNAVIKELSTNLQSKIKEAVKKASDLEVKEVNIKVKNIAPKQNETSNN